MHITEVLELKDINPLALSSWRDIKALPDFRYHRTRRVNQSSYGAHRASLSRRRRAVRAKAKPWRW